MDGRRMTPRRGSAALARLRRLERKLRQTAVFVALLGAGGPGLAERRKMAAVLTRPGISVIVPEDALPDNMGPSLAEKALFSRNDVDLVFVNVESWGSAAEFAQFHEDRRIAPKLRVLVSARRHPLHGAATGYLSDLYLSHLAEFGHVYAIDGRNRVRLPSALTVIGTLSERCRQIKALE